MDISNYWLGANFKTSYANPKTGVVYHMADYGLYKPLQPSATTAGETWHITSSQEVLALGNYDNALLSGYEIVYALYYNPSLRGWSMADGRGVYIGAGVTVLQIELCRRGLLEEKYITGYFCSKTDEAVRAFQSQQGLVSDGIAGSGTVNALLSEEPRTGDTAAPELTASSVGAATSKGFSLFLSGTDEKGLNAFRVDTRGEGDDVWVTRYYNAPASGSGTLDVDIWRQGNYAVRAAACDTDGNESPLADVGTVFIDTTSPVIRSLTITDITGTGFSLHHRVTDNGTLAGLSITLTSDTGGNAQHLPRHRRRERFPVVGGGADRGRMDDLRHGLRRRREREPLHVRLEIHRRDRAARSHRRPPRHAVTRRCKKPKMYKTGLLCGNTNVCQRRFAVYAGKGRDLRRQHLEARRARQRHHAPAVAARPGRANKSPAKS